MSHAKTRTVSVMASLLIVGVALGGCSTKSAPSATEPSSPSADSSPQLTSPDAPKAASPKTDGTWTTLLPGEAKDDLKFSTDGTLSDQDKVLLDSIPVTYVSDGSALYAKRLVVSDSSPSGNYTFVKGCEEADPSSGLCWAVFLVDRAEGTAYPVTVGKYGGKDWVQWSSDDRYAVLVEVMEGSSWIYVVDLQTEASKNLGEMSANIDLESFQWTGDRTFTITVDGSPMQVDLDTVFQ
ncbi:MAG: hypothetical protein IGR76_05405 [Synechococcales cyanobacterium T60_A2020_003]|nr:hypothetical protein [Synechococcales cyanobacterium T60_A2020_003]